MADRAGGSVAAGGTRGLFRLPAGRQVAAIKADLVIEVSPGKKVINVFQCRLRDVPDGLTGEKTLVRCNYHVVE